MTTQSKPLILGIVRALPRMLLDVCLMGLGAIVLIFITVLLFPEQRRLQGLVVGGCISLILLITNTVQYRKRLADIRRRQEQSAQSNDEGLPEKP